MGLKDQMLKIMAKEAAGKILPMDKPKKPVNWKIKLSILAGSLVVALSFVQEFLK